MLKSGLEAKVFADLFSWSDEGRTEDVAKKTSLIERSFRSFDAQQKGFITRKDLKQHFRGDPDQEDTTAAAEEDETLSLSAFSYLLSEHLENKNFNKGHGVYTEGEEGNKMLAVGIVS